MKTKDRGASLTIELTLSKYQPFGNFFEKDADSAPSITVLNPNGLTVVDAQTMTKSATGKYYYNVQTLETWTPGIYEVSITATLDGHDNTEIEKQAFRLE